MFDVKQEKFYIKTFIIYRVNFFIHFLRETNKYFLKNSVQIIYK